MIYLLDLQYILAPYYQALGFGGGELNLDNLQEIDLIMFCFLQDFLEVRGLGIINVRELFGDSAIKTNKYLRLIIRLESLDKDTLVRIDRLEGSYRTQRVLDLDIPEITLPVAPGRNLAVLLECAARNHMLRMSGYNASDEFSDRQRILLEQGNH